MESVIASALAGLSPLLAVGGLLALAAWRDRRRAATVARQIRLTDALAAELGGVVAPVLSKPLGGPWRVEMRVPVGRPALVSRVVALTHDTLTRLGATRYELVLSPEPRVARGGPAGLPVRRLRAA
jgi:hypothetical protein